MQPKTPRASADAVKASADAQPFVMPVRVYFEDTDAGGVVYYANYLKFCERARTEWLRALGFEQQALLDDTGLAFVVRSVQADYLASARLDDALMVQTRIDNVRRASILFAQNVLRDGKLLFTARVLVACVDLQRQRPSALPASLQALLPSPA